MFGTVARLRVKPDAEPLLFAWADGMVPNEGRPARMAGWVSSAIFRSLDEPGIYWMAVVFESREAYRANAEHPNQHREYQRLRSCLEADPEWHDGDVVVYSDGHGKPHIARG